MFAIFQRCLLLESRCFLRRFGSFVCTHVCVHRRRRRTRVTDLLPQASAVVAICLSGRAAYASHWDLLTACHRSHSTAPHSSALRAGSLLPKQAGKLLPLFVPLSCVGCPPTELGCLPAAARRPARRRSRLQRHPPAPTNRRARLWRLPAHPLGSPCRPAGDRPSLRPRRYADVRPMWVSVGQLADRDAGH